MITLRPLGPRGYLDGIGESVDTFLSSSRASILNLISLAIVAGLFSYPFDYSENFVLAHDEALFALEFDFSPAYLP